ncbi:MAG TPA: adenylate/guanylate cyclase domain-containing protein [Candidatus Tumulicola sp.]|nr:adenylate/guanylate cyclase domain-containing protein [Candidatus Tumulicola sp.]
MEHDRRENPWEKIAARLDEALDETRSLTEPAPSTRTSSTATKLLDLLARARREVHARELEASVASTRAQRLQDELEHQQRRADVLARIGKTLNAVRDLPVLVQLISDLAVEATGAERAIVLLPSRPDQRPEGRPERPELSAGTNLDPHIMTRPEFAVSRWIIEHVCHDGIPIVTTDAQNDPVVRDAPSVRSLHIRSIVCVPINNGNIVLGAIYVDSRIGADNPLNHDPELLGAIAEQAAITIENARSFEDLSHGLDELFALKSQNDEILESIASGVVVLDKQDVVRRFNRGAEMTFGLSASSVEGRHARALNTWLPGFTTLLEQFRSTTDARTRVELTGSHAERGPIVLQLTFFSIRSQAGTSGTAIVFNDLTASRALESANRAQLEKSERIARSFERYLAPHVVNSLMMDPDAVPLGGTRLICTMLFADIRGFTELSERLMPEEVVEILNRYLAATANVVFANLGLLDKYYGDGLMAVFGAPRPAADDAQRAVTAARQIMQQIERLNAARGANWPLAVSIGLATGDVVAGNIGSEQRLEYTVVGNAVNLAFRLQAIAEPSQILADAATYEKVQGQVTATRRQARIKGKVGPTPVYVLHG